MVRVVLSLGVVLALLWYLQRRLSRGSLGKTATNAVTVVGRQNIGQKASVVVVDVEGIRLVLGVTEQAVTVLHEKTPASKAASALDAAITTLGVPAENSVPARSVPSAAAFAHSLATANADDASAASPPVAQGESVRPLAGSILSPSTWRQTIALLRQ